MRRGCNSTATGTYVLCNAANGKTDHLLFNCSYSSRIWAHFAMLFHVLIPTTLLEACTSWVMKGAITFKPLGLLLTRVICWAIWAKCNSHIYIFTALDFYSTIYKIDHLLIAWIYAALDYTKSQLEEYLPTIKRSLVLTDTKTPEAQTPLFGQVWLMSPVFPSMVPI